MTDSPIRAGTDIDTAVVPDGIRRPLDLTNWPAFANLLRGFAVAGQPVSVEYQVGEHLAPQWIVESLDVADTSSPHAGPGLLVSGEDVTNEWPTEGDAVFFTEIMPGEGAAYAITQHTVYVSWMSGGQRRSLKLEHHHTSA
jgi:hypothetical protein